MSVVLATDVGRLSQPRTANDFLAANHTLITTYSTRTVGLAVVLACTRSYPFIVVDVDQVIPGMDFLSTHDFLVDLCSRRLHQPSVAIIDAEPSAQPTPLITTLRQTTQYEAILQEFPLFTSWQSAPSRVRHGMYHCIVTTGTPCFPRPRCLPPERLQAARKEFDLMLVESIVCPSDSNWALPLHMVPKTQDGEWRGAWSTGP